MFHFLEQELHFQSYSKIFAATTSSFLLLDKRKPKARHESQFFSSTEDCSPDFVTIQTVQQQVHTFHTITQSLYGL